MIKNKQTPRILLLFSTELIFVTTAGLSEGVMLAEESLPASHVSHMSVINIYIIILYKTWSWIAFIF